MKKPNDPIESLFNRLENQWDIYEPDPNPYNRFLERKQNKSKRVSLWYPISIAASILLLLGYFTFSKPKVGSGKLIFASKETQQTDSIFTDMIYSELHKIKTHKSPQNEKIIADALIQMQKFEADYDNLKLELEKNGETKQLLYAMIHNFQTQITFLETILEQLESNQKLNQFPNEKTI